MSFLRAGLPLFLLSLLFLPSLLTLLLWLFG